MAAIAARACAGGAGCAPRPAARGDRARVFRRLHPIGARRAARSTARHDQEQDVHRARAAARATRGTGIGAMASNAVHDLTPAYALDALDDTERVEYEEHLAGCDRCREELAALREAVSSLAYATAAPAPPPAL